MANAEAEHHVKLAAGTLEQFRLAYRVADRLIVTRPDLLLIPDAEFFLWNAAVLACDRSNLEPVTLENAAQDLGVIDKTNAGSDAYFLETHSLGKLTNLLDARPLAVARCLDHSGDLGNAPNPRIVVFTGRIMDAVGIYLCGAIPRTTFSRFARPTGAYVVRAICACRIFILHIRSPGFGTQSPQCGR
jgi:hypothetical protein